MGYALTLLVTFVVAFIGVRVHSERVVVIAYAVIIPLLAGMPRLVAVVSPAARVRFTSAWHGMVDRCILAMVILNAPGSIVLHAMGIQYDRVLHFSVSLVGFFLAVLVLSAAWPNLGKTAILKRSLGCVAVWVFLWEGVQFSIDAMFGTHLFNDVTQPISVDVIEDVIFGLLGAIAASFVFMRNDGFWRRVRQSVPFIARGNEQRA